jgi:N-acetylglucosamine-6-phosphate deacetylase
LQDRLHITLIADGIHLPAWLLKSWIEMIGYDRCIIISDSISAAGMPPGEYSIGDQSILVEPSRRTRNRQHGYLAGSASTMQDMDNFLLNTVSISQLERNQIMHRNAVSLLKMV